MIGLTFVLTTVCSAQVLVSGKDTVSCYTNKELRVITKAVLKGQECDTLLKLEKEQSGYLLKQIEEYEEIRGNMDQIIIQKDIMIENRDEVIIQKNSEIAKLNKDIRKQKILKVIGTGLFAITTVVFIIL